VIDSPAENLRHVSSADAIVAVPVTAAWTSPEAPRNEDRFVTQPVPDMALWMASLSHELRLDLLGRISTSALLGEPVLIISEHIGWSEVRLPWQPCASDPRGYPAWIPSAHLVSSSSGDAGGASTGGAEASVFSVTRRLVPVRANRSGPPVEVLSLGTRLEVVDVDPATGNSHAQVQVRGAQGTYWIDADCGVYAASPSPKQFELTGEPKRAEDSAKAGNTKRIGNIGTMGVLTAGIIAAGSELLGLPYLWGGLSGWGVDCSGLVHLAHRAMGLIVPRDSVDQHSVFGSVVGVPAVAQPVFFRYQTDSLRIHHVGLAVSETLMLHAPKTGRVVELLPIASEPYGAELEVTVNH
jgi:gamma-D-glutamyl-L-lysine dipeptidyl-peptidase